jgi:DNA-binding NtrC family response regulator
MPTVLLVDDDDSSRSTLSALLEDDGFVVRTAASCSEARATLSALADTDLVLLDQHLGDGVGSDLVPAIRTGKPRARIVLMSGSADLEELSKMMDAAFEKGRAFPELVALLRGLLSQ